MNAHSNTPRVIVFDHVQGLVRWLDDGEAMPTTGYIQMPEPEPYGPLCRASQWLWRRPRGRVLGNLISDARYWLWWLSR